MADNTSQVAGLFMTPEMYQQQQNQAALSSFAQQAQMDPMAQARMSLMYGGYQAGNALAGALGAQDPMMKALTLRNNVGRQIDWTNPDSIAQGAQALMEAGDVQGARQIAEEGRAASLKIAQAKKASGMIGATTVSERNRNLIQQVEVKLAKGEQLTPEEEANARWLVAQESKPKIFRDNDTGEIVKIDPLDITSAAPNLAKAFGKQTTGLGASSGVSSTGQTKLATPIRKEVGDVDQQLVTLENSVTRINELLPKIDNLNLGLAANLERSVKGFFGKETPDIKEFKQVFREAKKQANDILMAAKGTQTEGDAQRAYDQIADPDTWKNPDLLKSAFDDLAKAHKGASAALMAKRETLIGTGVPSIPGLGAGDVAPKQNPLSGANPQLQPQVEQTTKKQVPKDLLDKANEAIRKGADPAKVKQRLIDQGYSL
mgnify:CR=1 FL=1